MVKSRRVKKTIVLEGIRKKRKDKSEIIENVHSYIHKYDYIYVAKLLNQRNSSLKDLRSSLEPGKLLIGKNKLLQVAFNMSAESNTGKNPHEISSFLKGERGLIFTDLSPDDLKKVLSENSTMEIGREGSVSDVSCIVEPDTELAKQLQSAELYMKKQYPHIKSSIEGIVNKDTVTICEKGFQLNRYQYLLLKYLNIPTVKFEVKLIACLYKGNVTYLDDEQ
ncbi:hypothetical protein FG386_000704 [Cryptosporidium ryanae]|uniref:uncharacterized protein n=1 Tax=Cryptosporidium ryanae TaxID=515981 RepID=UPI00351A03A4|nr:hypothetical protein FG386_000704 [Cryptosporidium ryanae]